MNDLQGAKDEMHQALEAVGQGHVFRWWDEIGRERRRKLLSQLRLVDPAQLGDLISAVKAGTLTPVPDGQPKFPVYVRLPTSLEEEMERESARICGEELLRAGKVAAVTVAGGQGTRLGYDAPKGTFPIGAVSGKTIFHIHAERILATQRRYRSPVAWGIMTSDATDGDTLEYFEGNGYFGLPREDVLFFRQRMMPAVDRDFRLVMVAKDEILLSPNGHGGTLLALVESGVLDELERRGVEEISYFQVDNPLVPALDPVFLGFHRLSAAPMSSKAIWKREPEEPLGAFVEIGGKLAVVEYSDLSREQMYQRTPEGKLIYGLGSPAIHVVSTAFVRQEAGGGLKLPFHLAEKQADCLDDEGRLVQPEEKNVYKFETFIFDALRDAQRSVILEVRREEEFSPVKNKSGADSPETARRDMSSLYGTWLERAGIDVPRNGDGCPVHPIEISPLYALDSEELCARVPRDLRLDEPLYLSANGAQPS